MDDFWRCNDCDPERSFTSEYHYLQHRALKHDDWTGLDEWYDKRGKPNPYARARVTQLSRRSLDRQLRFSYAAFFFYSFCGIVRKVFELGIC